MKFTSHLRGVSLMSMLALSVNFSISTGICCSKCQSSADPFAIPEQADAIKKQVEFFYLSDVTLGEGIFKHAMMLYLNMKSTK